GLRVAGKAEGAALAALHARALPRLPGPADPAGARDFLLEHVGGGPRVVGQPRAQPQRAGVLPAARAADRRRASEDRGRRARAARQREARGLPAVLPRRREFARPSPTLPLPPPLS